MFCYSLVLLFPFILVSTGHPINSYEDTSFEQTVYMPEVPKWYSHCKDPSLTDSNFESGDNSKSINIHEYFRRTAKTASIAMKSAEDLKKRFGLDLEQIFDNIEIMKIKDHGQFYSWLPNQTEFSTNFKDMEGFVALGIVHRYIEMFAVAFEQIVFDQKYYKNQDQNDGNQGYNFITRNHFKNVQENNYSVLCEIRITLAVVLQNNNEDFLKNTERSIMPEEDRKLSIFSRRKLRDYLILRQYVRTTQYINNLMKHFGSV